MSTAGIFGVGAALPEPVIANAAFVERLDTSEEWIVRRTGIRERRWLNGTGSLADLAAEACAAALDDAHRDAAAVDRVIVSTITPDRLTPGRPCSSCAPRRDSSRRGRRRRSAPPPPGAWSAASPR